MSPPAGNRTEGILFAGLVAIALMLAGAIILHADTYAWAVPFAAGLALIAYGAGALRRAAKVKAWLTVKGTMLESRLGEVMLGGYGGAYVEYYPLVRFEYWTPSGHYFSENFTIAPRDYRNADRKKTEQLLNQYPAGVSTEVYVCPHDHRLAVLCPEVSPKRHSQYLAALVGGVLVSAVSLVVGIYAVA